MNLSNSNTLNPLPGSHDRNLQTDMERSSEDQRVTFSGCLFMGLTVMAIGLPLLSVMSRPDSDDELFGDGVLAVIIVAPLWAVVTFLYS